MIESAKNRPYLVSIVGPTAIGKTSLSIKLAQAFSSEIISADSRQFFKEMSIGTAVPSKEELTAIKHHFIQHISVQQSYSVGDFEREVIQKLDTLFAKHSVLFMVGGSGLYVKAVNEGLDKFPKIDPKIREELNAEFKENGLSGLGVQLKKSDPIYAQKVDLQNPQRVIRALEICIGSGKAYSYFLNQHQAKRNFKVLKIGLTAPRELIYHRINERVDIMMANNLLEEARALYPQRKLNALNTVGYKELFHYFDQKSNLSDAVSEIKKNTRRFAKRQLTWFRKDEGIKWFSYDDSPEDIVNYIQEKTTLG